VRFESIYRFCNVNLALKHGFGNLFMPALFLLLFTKKICRGFDCIAKKDRFSRFSREYITDLFLGAALSRCLLP
jgi:hypothetical protein